MKKYCLHIVMMAVLLCLISGLVFAQDVPLQPSAGVTFDYNRDRVQYEGQAALQESTHEATVLRSVTYGEVGGEQLILDIYKPATSDKLLPAVVLIHGGAGKFADRSDMVDDAEGLAAAGYVAFNIDYRLLQDNGSNAWPTQLDDAQLAVRWVRANAAKYKVDPDRICAFGHSFGGQLAALLGERDTSTEGDLPLAMYSSKVACVITIAGSLDPLRPFNDVTLQPVNTALYGGTPNEMRANYLSASALAQVDPNTSPFLIFHGADDEVNSVEQSRQIVDALHRAGVEVVYIEYPHATHFYWISFFEIKGSWDLVAPETLAFLGRHLAPSTS